MAENCVSKHNSQFYPSMVISINALRDHFASVVTSQSSDHASSFSGAEASTVAMMSLCSLLRFLTSSYSSISSSTGWKELLRLDSYKARLS